MALFFGCGVVTTVVLEWFATTILHCWDYSGAIPTLPILGDRLLPILQWLFLPPLIVWFTRRQLIAMTYIND